MINLTCFDQDELMALTEQDLRRENYAEALEKLKVIGGRNGVPVAYHAVLGRVYASLGLLQRARHAFATYVENTPDSIHEHFQLGMVERDMGNLPEAQQIWDQVLEKEQDYPPALYFKAASLVDLNEYREAMPLLQRLKDTAHQTRVLIGNRPVYQKTLLRVYTRH